MDLLQPPPDALLLIDLRPVLAGGLGDGDVDVHVGELTEELMERRGDGADVRLYDEPAPLVGPRQELDELTLALVVRWIRRQLAREDLAGRSVDRDRIALLDHGRADAHLALVQVDRELGAAGNARQAQAARD